MIINNVIFNADLLEILNELKAQLVINQIPLLNKIQDTPNNVMVSCPYHNGGQERKPSAGIKKSDGTFHCFACGEVHTLQEVISFCFGHTDDLIGGFGWSWLMKNFATVSIEERKNVELDFSRNKGTISKSGSSRDMVGNRSDIGADIGFVTEEELNSYRYYHPYMQKRKLTEEVIEFFDIGYDKATKCLTFPVKDSNGNCLFVARRSVHTKYFNYPSGVHKPLYGLYEYLTAVKASKQEDCDMMYGLNFSEWDPNTIIICESMLDALTAWTFNKYALALNGLGSESQFKELRALPCRKLILATDNDKAGKQARKILRENIRNKIITEYILPKGRKDLNDLSFNEFEHLEEVF